MRALGLKEAPTIAVNPYDNGIWLVDQKTALRLDVNGRTLTSISLVGTDVRQAQVAQDESLWILGNKQLAHYSPSGLLIAGFDLHAIANAEPKYFVVDDIGGSIWLAGEKQLIQVDLASAQHVLRRVALVDKVLGLVMQPRTGAIWVLGDDSLGVYDVTGTLVRDIDLKGQAIKGIDTLVLDAVADTTQRQPEEWLAPSGDLDRVYQGVAGDLLLREKRTQGERRLQIRQHDFGDAVVWNPGADKCAALADMPAAGYLNMLCVEAARITHPVQLAPGERWTGMQTLRLL